MGCSIKSFKFLLHQDYLDQKLLVKIELERKATGALSIKGNFMAGSLTYDGPIIMQGSVTSPSWTEEYQNKYPFNTWRFQIC